MINGVYLLKITFLKTTYKIVLGWLHIIMYVYLEMMDMCVLYVSEVCRTCFCVLTFKDTVKVSDTFPSCVRGASVFDMSPT